MDSETPINRNGLNQHRYIRHIGALLVTVILFATLQIVLYIPLVSSGTELSSEWFFIEEDEVIPQSLPFVEDFRGKKTITLTTSLPATAGESLVFLNLNATALTIRVDGNIILQMGTHEDATANLWNSMIAIPLDDTEEEGRVLELTMTGHHVLGISLLPVIEESGTANKRLDRHRGFYHDMVVFFMGTCVMIGTILIGFSALQKPGKVCGILLGLSSFFVAAYALDFTFRYSTGNFEIYNIAKRIIIASGHIGTILFLAGMDKQANGEFRSSRWMAIPSILCVLAILFIPGIGLMMQFLAWLDLVLLANLVLVIIIVGRKMRGHLLYVIASELLILAIIQIILIMTGFPNHQAVLQYVVVIASVLIGLQFLIDYREVFQDRDKLRKEYNRDALTGAFNRRALSSINLKEYDSAIFLDFDYFKSFNDSFGHEKGDELLRGFVRVAHTHLRRHDLVIRYGGDEFLILLGDSDSELTEVIIERIREAFRTLAPESRVDISYGINSIGQAGELNLEDLDKKMYAMKESKRRI